MDIESDPPLSEVERLALEHALEELSLHAGPERQSASAWQRATLDEATSSWDDDDGYALSPRSTRGATRA